MRGVEAGFTSRLLDSLSLQLHDSIVAMKPTAHGPYIVVTKSDLVFGATSVEATDQDFVVRLKGLEHRLKPDDIAIVYEVDPQHPAARIDPGILSTVTALDRLMVEFSRTNPPHRTIIFGSGSLALTLLPDRSTNDLDTIATDEFATFVNNKATQTDIHVELLDEALLRLLGPWSSRASDLIGPLGSPFRLVHPLDTVMQKLLRFSPEHFRDKDQEDIAEVLASLKPTGETLVNLLTENPARYARLPGKFMAQAEAVERNTRWFLDTFLPPWNFEQIVRATGDRAVEGVVAAGFFPQIPTVDFRSFLKPQSGSPSPTPER